MMLFGKGAGPLRDAANAPLRHIKNKDYSKVVTLTTIARSNVV
jgi:hypothetical protein